MICGWRIYKELTSGKDAAGFFVFSLFRTVNPSFEIDGNFLLIELK